MQIGFAAHGDFDLLYAIYKDKTVPSLLVAPLRTSIFRTYSQVFSMHVFSVNVLDLVFNKIHARIHTPVQNSGL